jgi:hypothetical protein
MLVQRSNNRTRQLNGGHVLALPDGRQEVRWQTSKVPPLEVYFVRPSRPEFERLAQPLTQTGAGP